MNKREFVIGAAAIAATGAGDAARPGAAGLGGRAQRLAPLEGRQSLVRWQAYVDQTFEMAAAAGGSRLRLRAVDPRHDASPGLEQFSLRFDVEDGAPPVGLASLRHASGQQVLLHLERAGTTQLRAHFSLIAPPPA